MTVGAIVAVCLLGGIIAGAIAQGKTGRFWGFFIFGALFPLIGIIVAALQPRRISSPTYAAGWYPDPQAANGQRWYDGQGWTAHTTQ